MSGWETTLLGAFAGATIFLGLPLGRVGDPTTDIGPPSVFLCSEDARYVTGQTLVVSGGRFTGL